jgi:hypothetical protein
MGVVPAFRGGAAGGAPGAADKSCAGLGRQRNAAVLVRSEDG